METIRLVNVTIGNGRRPLLSGINATVRSGELTCLVGRNGTGKSTLLRTMAGLQKPLAGDIVFAPSLGEGRGERVAIVLTARPDVRNMTVAEVVGMGRSPYTGFFGGLSRQDKAVVEEAMAAVGMAAYGERMIQTLSDGECQKVMIAKALAQQTPVILLDEPTAFLDYPSRVEMFAMLSRMAKERDKTIVMATHDVELAQRYAGRFWEI